MKALVGELVIGVCANGFEHRHDIQLATVPGNAARQNGATVHKDARAIHARHGHHAGRHVLVATANSHEAIHAFATDDRLNGIRNHLATHERILHALRSHGNAIGDSDGVEDNRLAASLVGATLGLLREQINVHIARGHIAPGGCHADNRFAEIAGLKASGVEHCPARCAVWSIQHDGRARTKVGLFLGFLAHERGCFGSKTAENQAKQRVLVGDILTQ